jgi:hypothetical protein
MATTGPGCWLYAAAAAAAALPQLGRPASAQVGRRPGRVSIRNDRPECESDIAVTLVIHQGARRPAARHAVINRTTRGGPARDYHHHLLTLRRLLSLSTSGVAEECRHYA